MQVQANQPDPGSLNDLKKLFNRGLNTWDSAPTWLFKLSQDLNDGKIVGVSFFTNADSQVKHE